jgi:hypothetical protein
VCPLSRIGSVFCSLATALSVIAKILFITTEPSIMEMVKGLNLLEDDVARVSL